MDSNSTISDELVAIHSQMNHILTSGFYEHHMYRWLRAFDRSQILVVDGDDMMRDLGGVVEQVQEFLKLPKLLLREDFVRDPDTGFFCYRNHRTLQLKCLKPDKMRTRNSGVQPSSSTTKILTAFYKNHVMRLEKMLDRKFKWFSV